jgi:hypothetical protein
MNRIGWLIVLLVLTAIPRTQGVILLDTGDPSVNTTAPGGSLTDSGWQYEADWGGYLGTPIAPNFFISAAHIGQPASGLIFEGNGYKLVGSFSLPGSDFLIWKVAGTFTDFAPLYTRSDEVGEHLVVVGCGTQRGTERTLDDTLRGWNWGISDQVRRWGENDVTSIVPFGGHDLIYATFDQHVVPGDHPNEAHLSSGDSGGGIFLNDAGTWKLAGINFAVDGHYWVTPPPPDQDPSLTQFDAAMFDAVGFYYFDDTTQTYVQVPGPDPSPTGFYSSRISSELAWIASVIADPQVGWENNRLTLTYWRINAPSSDIVYEVDQSSDMVSWGPALTQDDIVATAGDLQQIKSTIDSGTTDHLFVRLKVTRPQNTTAKDSKLNQAPRGQHYPALIPITPTLQHSNTAPAASATSVHGACRNGNAP